MSHFATVLRMPVEDTRFLGQKQRPLLHTAITVARVYRISAFSCPNSQGFNSYRVIWRGPGDTCMQNELWERTWSLGNLLQWMVSTPALCSRGKHFLRLLRLFIIQTSSKREFATKCNQCLCLQDVQGAYGEFSPNNLLILLLLVVAERQTVWLCNRATLFQQATSCLQSGLLALGPENPMASKENVNVNNDFWSHFPRHSNVI